MTWRGIFRSALSMLASMMSNNKSWAQLFKQLFLLKSKTISFYCLDFKYIVNTKKKITSTTLRQASLLETAITYCIRVNVTFAWNHSWDIKMTPLSYFLDSRLCPHNEDHVPPETIPVLKVSCCLAKIGKKFKMPKSANLWNCMVEVLGLAFQSFHGDSRDILFWIRENG